MDFVYLQSRNYMLDFYRQSTDTDILWFDSQTSQRVITKDYEQRVQITNGNITLCDVTCADAGVYVISISSYGYVIVQNYTIYASHSCSTYNVMGHVGSPLHLLPYVTTEAGGGAVWTEGNGRTTDTKDFIVHSLDMTYNGTNVTFSDNGDIKTVYIYVNNIQKTVAHCLLDLYRWYYRDVSIVSNSRFFLIDRFSKSISGYGDVRDYKCKSSKKRNRWMSMASGCVSVICVILLCCGMVVYHEYNVWHGV